MRRYPADCGMNPTRLLDNEGERSSSAALRDMFKRRSVTCSPCSAMVLLNQECTAIARLINHGAASDRRSFLTWWQWARRAPFICDRKIRSLIVLENSLTGVDRFYSTGNLEHRKGYLWKYCITAELMKLYTSLRLSTEKDIYFQLGAIIFCRNF